MPCAACDPALAPGAVGAGVHDARLSEDTLLTVRKYGEVITDCYRVDTTTGTAWRYVAPYRSCDCGRGTAAYIDRGHFTVADERKFDANEGP